MSANEKELKRTLLGDLIGEGACRKVYQCRLNRDFVVKQELWRGQFQNIVEWEAWGWARGTDLEKWLAPCFYISDYGVYLVQKQCRPLQSKKELPKRLPKVLTDLKAENFGWYDGRVVCFDYGTINARVQDFPRNLVKPKWIEPQRR